MNEVAPLSQSLDELQEQLKQYVEEQLILLEVTQRIASGGSLGDLLPDIAQLALRGLLAGGVHIVLGDAAASKAYAAGELSGQMKPFDAPVLRAAAARGAVEYADLRSDELPDELAPLRDALGAALAMPLSAQGTLYGVLWVGYEQRHPFTRGEKTFLSILVGQTAVAIANAFAFNAARRGREQLAAILTSSADPILVIDNDDRVIMLNPAAEGAFGVSAETASGQRVDEALTDAAPLVDLLTGDGNGAESLEWQNAAGQVFAPRISDMHDEQEVRTGRVLILRDITRFKTLRDNQAEFVSTVSHDLRSPLTYMSGYIDMLPMVGGLNERQQRFAEKISSGIAQMTDLVDKILDASRLDPEGNYQLNREPCDVAQLINEVASTHTQPAEKKGLKLVVQALPNLPILNLDLVMLRRALNNLTDNAIKYTPEGGTITARAEVNGNALLLSVQDTGLGISDEDQKHLFERFRRVRRREFHGIKGSGLGLYIVRRVAQRHGGDAWVKSEPGKGSTFTISLPLEGENLIGGAKPRDA